MGTVEEIGAKMDALGLWSALVPVNWAVKPTGTAFPYFCVTLPGEVKAVKARFLMLEGWQTLHDFMRARADRDFGFCTTPIEFPHFELIVLANGETRLSRCDAGYLPVPATDAQAALAARLLWESYGIMLRLESNPKLPLKYADERAVFARVESRTGEWSDAPLVIPNPPPHVEKIAFAKQDLAQAKDLPLVAGDTLLVDFGLLPNAAVKVGASRPRCVYRLLAVDPALKAPALDLRTSISPDGGLRAIWETMPTQFLKALIRRGRVPGEVKVRSGRVFRLLRPLCLELPFKLSLHDKLEGL